MDIFTKYNSKTWVKDVGYPCIAIINPETYECEYNGRNPKDFFKEFDIKYYLKHKIQIHYEGGGWTELGTIESLNGKLPEFKLNLIMNEV